MYRGSGQQPSIRHPLCHGSQRANRRNAPWPAFAPHPISISDETNATMRMQSSPPPQARLSFTLHQRVRRPEGGPVATVAAARSHTPPTSLLIVVVVVAVAVAAVTMAVAALPYCSHGGALAFTDGDAGEHAAATHPRGVAHQGVPNQAIVMRISPCTEQPAQSRGRAIMPRQANNGDKKRHYHEVPTPPPACCCCCCCCKLKPITNACPFLPTLPELF